MKQVKSAVSATTPAPTGAAGGGVNETKRTCLLVLGMHRSGTSALTRTISLLGATLPSALLGRDGSGAESNPLGHWEPEKVVALNDAALQAAGSKWRTPFGVDPSWFSTSEALELRERAVDLLAREYGTSKLFVLKDPRTCLVAPLWLGALEDAGVTPAPVHVYRSPAEVAASLQKRNEIDPALGELLWLRYVLEAERATRGLVRSHLSYNSLLSDWKGAVDGVAEALGLVWPVSPATAAAKIDAYIVPSARHHVDEQPSKSVGYVDEVYDCLKRWSSEGESPDDWQMLDEARGQLDRSVQMLPGALTAAFDLTAMTAKLRKIRSGLDSEASTLKDAEAALGARVGELEGALAEADSARRKDAIALAETRTAREILEREWKARIAGLEALIAVLRDNADAATARATTLERSQHDNQRVLLENVKQAALFAERLSASQAQLGQYEVRSKELEYALEGERRLRDAVERSTAARLQEMDALLRSDGRLSAVEEELGRALEQRAEARSAMADLAVQLREANDRTNAAIETLARAKVRFQMAEAAQKATERERDALALKIVDASKAEAERAALSKKLSKAAATENELRASVLALEAKVASGAQLARERQAAIEHLRRDRAAAVAKRDARIETLMGSIRALEAVHARPTRDESLGKRIRHLFSAVTGGRRRERDAAIREAVEESGLFDVAYYLRRYPDVAAEGGDPLDHYLRHGGIEGRGPSARFNGKFYLEQNPDVREAGVNPLVHYITYGRAEGRRALPDSAALPTRHGLPKLAASPSAPAAPAPTPSPQPAKRVVAVSRSPEPATPTPLPPRAWSARTPSFAALADIIAPWRKTGDLPVEGALVVRSAVVALEPPHERTAPRAALDWLAFLDGTSLRPVASPEDAVRTTLCEGAVSIDDIWFENDKLLHLRFSCEGRLSEDRHYGARLFQFDERDSLAIIGESVFATPGLQRLAAPTLSHFRPILVVITDDAGRYHDAMLLAFPSLCRRGVHFAELVAAFPDATPMEALGAYTAALLEMANTAAGHAVSSVAIDLAAAIGTEPVLQPAFADWLAALGINVTVQSAEEVSPAVFAALSEQIRSADGAAGPLRPASGTLVVPADCLPSLSVLFAAPDQVASDGHVTVIGVGALAAEPQYALSVPLAFATGSACAGDQPVLPYLRAGEGQAGGLGKNPLALQPSSTLASQDPRRIFPVPMDAPHPLLQAGAEPVSTSVILNCDAADESGLLACVEGVAAQTDVDVREFLLVGRARSNAASVIERHFSDARAKVRMLSEVGPVTPALLIEAAQSAASENVLFLHHSVILSDRRTMAALAYILKQADVFSAGCALASDLSGPRGRPVQRLVSGYLALEEGQVGEVDLGAMKLPLLFPVAAPSRRLYLVRRTPWIEKAAAVPAGGELDAFHLAVGVEATKAGTRNLSTTSLTAFDAAGAISTDVLNAVVPRDVTTAIRQFRQ